MTKRMRFAALLLALVLALGTLAGCGKKEESGSASSSGGGQGVSQFYELLGGTKAEFVERVNDTLAAAGDYGDLHIETVEENGVKGYFVFTFAMKAGENGAFTAEPVNINVYSGTISHTKGYVSEYLWLNLPPEQATEDIASTYATVLAAITATLDGTGEMNLQQAEALTEVMVINPDAYEDYDMIQFGDFLYMKQQDEYGIGITILPMTYFNAVDAVLGE